MNKKYLLVELGLGFFLGFGIIIVFFSGSKKFEDLALGTETVSYQALDENKKLIHIVKIDRLQEAEFLSNWEKRGKKKTILVFGNSQMHSINQMKKDEMNFLELLYSRNQNSSVEFLGNSMPNAGMQEFYLAYEYWKHKLPLKAIVIPVFMDDMREDGIRDVFFPDLIDDRFQINDSADFLVSQINRNLRTHWSKAIPGKSSGGELVDAETPQEKSEAYLNDKLEKHSKAWGNRQNVRGEFFALTYKFRNTVFGINATSIRRMIPQRYNSNMHALELIIDDCERNHINVLVYIPPIRSDATLPYDLDEYKKFKNGIRLLVEKRAGYAVFKNYEDIIPPILWGYREASSFKSEREIDFMHFQFKAHEILADSLAEALKVIDR